MEKTEKVFKIKLVTQKAIDSEFFKEDISYLIDEFHSILGAEKHAEEVLRESSINLSSGETKYFRIEEFYKLKK